MQLIRRILQRGQPMPSGDPIASLEHPNFWMYQ